MRIFYVFLIATFLFGFCTEILAQTQKKHNTVNNEAEKKEGFKVLFDGSSLDQWVDNNDQYYLRNGAIVKKPTGNGNLYTKQQYEDFILRFEFQLTPGANNGLGIRHKMFHGERGYDGMELQILDNSAPVYRHLKPTQYHGSLYLTFPAERNAMKPVGEWNTQEVKAVGTRIQITLNGELILDADIASLPAEQLEKKKILTYPKGHIAFLGHDTEVIFRNIRVKEL